MLHSKGRIAYSDRIVDLTHPERSTEPRLRDATYRIAGPDRRCAVSTAPGKEWAFVGCRNPEYAFALIGSQSDESLFRIKALEKGFAGTDLKPGRDLDLQFRMFASPVVYAPFTVESFDLSDIVQDGTFALKHIGNLADGSKSLVMVEFDCPNHDERLTWLRGVRLVLDPGNGWGVTEYEVTTPEHVKNQVRVKYAETVDVGSGLRPPVEVEARNSSSKTEESHRFEQQNFRLDEIAFIDVDPQEFMLSAFGLPEPSTDSRGSYSGVIWGILTATLGIACLLAGIRRLKQQPRV